MQKILKHAVINCLLTICYIAAVASFMVYLTDTMNDIHINKIAGITTMLTLLVMSVAVVGTLIFGRPVIWYLDGQKRDAVKLLLSTLVALFLILVIIVGVIFISTL